MLDDVRKIELELPSRRLARVEYFVGGRRIRLQLTKRQLQLR